MLIMGIGVWQGFAIFDDTGSTSFSSPGVTAEQVLGTTFPLQEMTELTAILV
jgi:hypothetical protein